MVNLYHIDDSSHLEILITLHHKMPRQGVHRAGKCPGFLAVTPLRQDHTEEGPQGSRGNVMMKAQITETKAAPTLSRVFMGCVWEPPRTNHIVGVPSQAKCLEKPKD